MIIAGNLLVSQNRPDGAHCGRGTLTVVDGVIADIQWDQISEKR